MALLNADDPLRQLGAELSRRLGVNFDIDGYKPLSHQKEFHGDRTVGRVIFGGNRSGKSLSSVVEMFYWATGTNPYRSTPRPPLALRHVAVDKPQGIDKVLIELYKRLVPKRYLRGGAWERAFQTVPPTLFFSNDSFIEFLSYEQALDRHAGTSRDAVAFDEEPDEAIFNENMARLIDKAGSWWMAMTPLEGLSWVYDRFWLPYEEGELDANVSVYRFNTDDNIHIPKGAFDILLAGLSSEEREARRTGKFVALSGLIYPFNMNIHVKELPAQNHLLTVAGMDHGLRNPTAWLWAQINSDGTLNIVKEHCKNELLVKDHAQIIKLIESGNQFLKPSYRVGDPSIVNRNAETGQSIQTEYANYGINIAAGNNDVDSGINRVASLMDPNQRGGPRLFFDKDCRALIKELRTYRWDEWASRKAETAKAPKNNPKKRDDHCVDAMRYLVMSRPYHDTGSGTRIVHEEHDPNIKYATRSLRHPSVDNDWRNGSNYDDVLGDNW